MGATPYKVDQYTYENYILLRSEVYALWNEPLILFISKVKE